MRKMCSKEVQSESCRRNNETEEFQLPRRIRRPEEMNQARGYEDEVGNKGKLRELTVGRDGGKRKTEETFFFTEFRFFELCEG